MISFISTLFELIEMKRSSSQNMSLYLFSEVFDYHNFFKTVWGIPRFCSPLTVSGVGVAAAVVTAVVSADTLRSSEFSGSAMTPFKHHPQPILEQHRSALTTRVRKGRDREGREGREWDEWTDQEDGRQQDRDR